MWRQFYFPLIGWISKKNWDCSAFSITSWLPQAVEVLKPKFQFTREWTDGKIFTKGRQTQKSLYPGLPYPEYVYILANIGCSNLYIPSFMCTTKEPESASASSLLLPYLRICLYLEFFQGYIKKLSLKNFSTRFDKWSVNDWVNMILSCRSHL